MTIKNLLARGIDSNVAKKIVAANYTLSMLSSASREELQLIGVDNSIRELLFNSGRPPIPEEIVENLLHKSRRTCCICRKSKRSIIIHHIERWETSQSNEEKNLAVLCLIHHDEAHNKKELSQNLTEERIRSAKNSWEETVEKLDREIVQMGYKELNVTTLQLSNLKEKWFRFFKEIGIDINIIIDPLEKLKFDFILAGKNTWYAKVFDVEKIEDVLNNENLIQGKKNDFLDSIIILSSHPFLSYNGFYSNEQSIQVGWIYSFGAQEWDHLMLKNNFDLSNSKFHVQNLLYENTNYKSFMTGESYESVMEIWNKS